MIIFQSELEANCFIVRDHFHLKDSIWKTQLGESLYLQIKEHPEAALNCETKEEYDFHVKETHKALS